MSRTGIIIGIALLLLLFGLVVTAVVATVINHLIWKQASHKARRRATNASMPPYQPDSLRHRHRNP